MIITHVQDLSVGEAAVGVTVILEMRQAKVAFIVRDTDEHCHVPLLLGPFGYSIYREG